FMVFTLANVGLPGTSGFIGEFLSLIGTFRINIPVATFATLGVILSAAYALWLYGRMIFGALKPSLEGIRDIGWRETGVFAALVPLTILFGVMPKPVLDMSAASVAQLLENYNHAIATSKNAELSSAPLGTAAAELAQADRGRSVARWINCPPCTTWCRFCRNLCWLAAPCSCWCSVHSSASVALQWSMAGASWCWYWPASLSSGCRQDRTQCSAEVFSSTTMRAFSRC